MVGTLVEHHPSSVEHLAHRHRQTEELTDAVVAVGHHQLHEVVATSTCDDGIQLFLIANHIDGLVRSCSGSGTEDGPLIVKGSVAGVIHLSSFIIDMGIQMQSVETHDGVLRKHVCACRVNFHRFQLVVIVITLVLITSAYQHHENQKQGKNQ